MNKVQIISQVKSLNIPEDDCIVFGSCPMAVAGIREANDIDMYVTPAVMQLLKKKGWKKLIKSPGDEPYTNGVFEAHDNWNFSHYNPTFLHLLKNSEVIDGVRVASLEEVRRWKAGSKGEKHENDVRLIEEYLGENGQTAVNDHQDIVAEWKKYLDAVGDWQELIKGVTPKATDCGPVYELPNPIDRPDEGFAIADMREITYAAPHYHTNDETEIYIVVSGSGTVVIGGKEHYLELGDSCVTYAETAHFTIPKDNLVLAVINTPPFEAKNIVTLEEKESRPEVGYSADQLLELTQKP